MPKYPVHIPEPASLLEQTRPSLVLSAATAIAPEAATDVLRLFGFRDETILQELTSVIDLVFLSTMISLSDEPVTTSGLVILGLIAHVLAQEALKALGCSDKTSQLAGVGASFAISALRAKSAVDLTTSAVAFSGIHLGLWGKRKLIADLHAVHPVLATDATIIRL